MRLGRVVNAILVDLASAQHQANKYARELSAKYKPDTDNPDTLAAFRVPGGALDEIEFDLKFAICDVQEVEGRADPTLNLTVLGRMVEGYAHKAIARLGTVIEANIPSATTQATTQDLREDSTWETVVRNLRSKTFEQHLCEVIMHGIQQHKLAILEEITSLHTTKFLEASARKVLTDHIKNRADLTKILATPAQNARTIQAVFEADLPPFLAGEQPEELVTQPKPIVTPSVEVVLNPDDLKEAPPETLSSIRLKASLNHYRWSISDVSESLTEV